MPSDLFAGFNKRKEPDAPAANVGSDLFPVAPTPTPAPEAPVAPPVSAEKPPLTPPPDTTEKADAPMVLPQPPEVLYTPEENADFLAAAKQIGRDVVKGEATFKLSEAPEDLIQPPTNPADDPEMPATLLRLGQRMMGDVIRRETMSPFGPGGRYVADIAAGTMGLPEGLAAAAETIGRQFDEPKDLEALPEFLRGPAEALGGLSKEIGGMISERAEEVRNILTPPDANFADAVAQGVGSTAAFFVPGLGVQAGATRMAIAAPRLAVWLGVGASSALEAMVESGLVSKESYEKFGDDKEAMKAGTMAFISNLPILMLTNRFGLFSQTKVAGKAGRQLLVALTKHGSKTGIQEGLQEVFQQVIANIMVYDPVFRGAMVSGGVGFFSGGGMGATTAGIEALSRADRLAEQPVPPAPKLAPEEVEAIKKLEPSFAPEAEGPAAPVATAEAEAEAVPIAPPGKPPGPPTAPPPTEGPSEAAPEPAGAPLPPKVETKGLKTTKQVIARATGLEPSPKITIRESVLLKLRLKSEARGARIGAAHAQMETRAKLMMAFREKAADIKAIKKQITSYITENLPLPSRGKFLVMVRSASTPKAAVKAFQRVDAEVARVRRRHLTAEIKRRARRILDSGMVAIDYKVRVRNALSGLSLTKPSKTTIQRLQDTQAFLDREEAAGRDVEMPKRMLDRLSILTKRPVAELPPSILEGIVFDLDTLEKAGRAKLKTFQAIYQYEKERISNELVSGTVALEKQPQLTAEPGDRLTTLQKTQNAIAKGVDGAQHVDLSISPMDVVFDILDGVKGYMGPNYTLFKKRLDQRFGAYLNERDAVVDPVQKMAVDLELGEQNMERIAVHAYREQANGRDYLLENGMTQEAIDKVELSKNEMKLYKAMREAIEKPYSRVEKTLRVVYNAPIGKIDNYFPVQIDFEAISDVAVNDKIGDAYNNQDRWTKSTEKGFTKKRVGGATPININAMDVFTKHMDDAYYFVNLQADVKMLFEVAHSKEYADAAGPVGQRIVLEWLDLMARKGGAEGQKKIAALDMIRRNFGASILGLKLSSIFIQPTALFDGASIIGGKYAINGLWKVLLDPEHQAFLEQNMPELRNRRADDPAYLELSRNKALADLQAKGFWALQKADYITASAIVSGAYQRSLDRQGKTMDLENPDPDAIQEVQLILRRTQSSAFFKDLSLALTRGNFSGNRSVDKAIFQFKSFMLNRWSLIRHDMYRAGFRGGDPKKGAEIASWMIMATLAETGVRGGTKALVAGIVAGSAKAAANALDEDREFWDRFGLELLNNIPFIGDMISLAIYEGTPIPALSPVVDFPSGLKGMALGSTEAARRKGLVKAIGAAASASGIPGVSQAEQFFREAVRKHRIPFAYAKEMSNLKGAITDGQAEQQDRARYERLKALRREHAKLNDEYSESIKRGDLDRSRIVMERWKGLLDRFREAYE